MDKFEYARYLRKVAQDDKRTRETIAHKKRVRLTVDASTTNYRGRKRYADGWQSSSNDKIDVMQTPIKVAVTTEMGRCINKYASVGVVQKCTLTTVNMPDTQWARFRRGSNK